MKQRTLIATILWGAMLCLMMLFSIVHIPARAQADPTSQKQTLDAIIKPRLTQTARRIATLTATYSVQQTINAVLGQTLTALSVNNTTPGQQQTANNTIDPQLPVGEETAQYLTLVANVNQRLTQTAQSQQTAAFQLTVNNVINQTLGVTATRTPLQAGSTLDSGDPIGQNLTLTAQFQDVQLATAAVQTAVADAVNKNMTATAQLVRASVAHGYKLITPASAGEVKEIFTFQGHTNSVQSVAFSPNGDRIASASSDNSVRLWDTLTGVLIHEFEGLTDRQSVAFSPDGLFLAASSSDQTIRVWNLNNFDTLPVLKKHKGAVVSIDFNNDGSLLASGSEDKSAIIWPFRGNFSAVLTNPRMPLPVHAVVFTPDGTRLLVGNGLGVTVWEVQASIPLRTFQEQQTVFALAVTLDNSIVATGGNAGYIQLWSLVNGQRLKLFSGQQGWITSVAFSPDNSLLASACRDGSIWLFDIITGKSVAKLRGHVGGVQSVVFSPDGTRLVSGGLDNTVRIWGIRVAP